MLKLGCVLTEICARSRISVDCVGVELLLDVVPLVATLGMTSRRVEGNDWDI